MPRASADTLIAAQQPYKMIDNAASQLTLSTLSSAIFQAKQHQQESRREHQDSITNGPRRISTTRFATSLPATNATTTFEPPFSLNDRSKDHLLFSVFHTAPLETVARTASPDSDEFDIGTASPLTGLSVDELERVYDRDTWRLYNRIQAARAPSPPSEVNMAPTTAAQLPPHTEEETEQEDYEEDVDDDGIIFDMDL